MRIIRLLLPLLVLAGGCTSTLDPESSVAPAALEITHAPEPMDYVRVRIIQDLRPLEQRGRRRVGGRSYIGDRRLSAPLEIAFMETLRRELEAAGLARRTGFEDDPRGHMLDLTLHHLYASFSEGLENLTVVLPTSRVEARVDFAARLRDPVGRPIHETRHATGSEGLASALGDPEEQAVEALGTAMHAAVRRLMAELVVARGGRLAEGGEASAAGRISSPGRTGDEASPSREREKASPSKG